MTSSIYASNVLYESPQTRCFIQNDENPPGGGTELSSAPSVSARSTYLPRKATRRLFLFVHLGFTLVAYNTFGLAGCLFFLSAFAWDRDRILFLFPMVFHSRFVSRRMLSAFGLPIKGIQFNLFLLVRKNCIIFKTQMIN